MFCVIEFLKKRIIFINKMKKILVTGGSGFIGTNLINYYSNKNKYIINFDKLTYASTPEKFKKKFLKKKNYFFKKIDLSSSNEITSLLHYFQPDLIINLASESHVDRSIDNPLYFIRNNIDLASNLFSSIVRLRKKSSKINPKILHISTDEVFGSKLVGLSKENDKLDPRSPYSASKAGVDLIAKSFIETYNLKISIVRFSNNYGPYQHPEKFLPTIIRRLKKKNKISLYGKGINIREWSYVHDTCICIDKLVNNFKPGEDYNLGSGKRMKNINLIKKVIEIFYNNKSINIKNYFDFVADRPGHDMRYALSTNKFDKKFKNIKFNSIENGLKKTIDWYIRSKKWNDYMSKKFLDKRIGNI